jgi:hypothetical protein
MKLTFTSRTMCSTFALCWRNRSRDDGYKAVLSGRECWRKATPAILRHRRRSPDR